MLIARYPREQWARPRQSRRDGALLAVAPRHVPRAGRHDRGHRRGSAAARCRRRNFPACWCRGCNSCCRSSNVHHQIEDLHYFPIFRAADERLARGFDVLEEDHHAIHADMARRPRPPTRCCARSPASRRVCARCGDDYAAASGALIKGLIRHLDDEEDLIVPLILDRGEDALGVAHTERCDPRGARVNVSLSCPAKAGHPVIPVCRVR